MNNLVTVGITTYNRPDTLRQTINSVIAQTYKNLEIIVIDDCSDGAATENVINEFQKRDSRILFYKCEKKKCHVENLNYCANLAKGKFFIWINDDDWIDNFYIERCLKYRLDNPEYILVCGKTRFYRGDEYAFDGKIINVEENSKVKRMLLFLDRQLGTANSPNFGIIETKEVLNTPLKWILGHDNVWLTNLAYLGKIKTLEDVYIHRRLGGTSKSLKKSAKAGNYSYYEINYPFVALWSNIFVDVAWESKALKSLNLLNRLLIAMAFNVMLLFNLKKYFDRYYKLRKVNIDQKFLWSDVTNRYYYD